MSYDFLLESVWHPPLIFEEHSELALPPELELQALWFAGAFGREFRCKSGKSVKIIQFGEWNRGAGPDFIHASVEIDGMIHNGPIELDHSPSHWESHGHSTNPAFRDVVLHVCFHLENKEHFIRNCEHREVEQILISNTTLNDALNRPQREIAIAHPGRCLRPLAGMSPKSIEKLLEQAAQFRARRKAGRWLRVEQAHTRDAALFQATAETLGYRGNSLAMQILSQRCRLDWLRADVEAAQSVMFGTAGFLAPELHQQAPAETRGYLRNLWDLWWKSRFRFETDRSRIIPWKPHGQRPANHPHRRVGALSVLAQSWPTFRKLALASPFSAKPLVDFLQSLEHPFWSFHYTLTSERQPRKISLFGRSHALELIANHLAPIALHEERMTWKSYHQIRHSAANDQVKRCAIRLFGSLDTARPWTRRLCHHQALIQIYQDFCLNDYSDCSLCQFPEQLAQWR